MEEKIKELVICLTNNKRFNDVRVEEYKDLLRRKELSDDVIEKIRDEFNVIKGETHILYYVLYQLKAILESEVENENG